MTESPAKPRTGPTNKDRAYWEKHARGYDASLGPLGRPLPRMLELVGEAVSGAGRVLEVAAGTGLVTPILAANATDVVATDYASAMIERLRSKINEMRITNVQCEQADIYALPFEAASFDVVLAANVLHLVPDLHGAVVALQQMLKPSGRLVTPTFCHAETWLSSAVSRLLALTAFPGHRRFTAQSPRDALVSEGLHVRLVETLPGLIPIGYVDGSF